MKPSHHLQPDGASWSLLSAQHVDRDVYSRIAAQGVSAVPCHHRSCVQILFQTTVGIEDELEHKDITYVPLRDPAIMPSVLVALVRAKQKLSVAAAIFLEEVRKTLAKMDSS